ncbi:hypothetical protein [Actinomadura macra]|uniref:hypothetical protein n=1 Tax=Actinomadura macra TaxID=46164 RepID=UPI000830C1D0|nr:hypothetical protein [Actinomadura macra]
MSNTLSLTSMSNSDLAQILFSSGLQQSDHPSAEQVRTAIDAWLCACDGDRSICAAVVAQEAGDHPESYATRMRWALSTVSKAYAAAA